MPQIVVERAPSGQWNVLRAREVLETSSGISDQNELEDFTKQARVVIKLRNRSSTTTIDSIRLFDLISLRLLDARGKLSFGRTKALLSSEKDFEDMLIDVGKSEFDSKILDAVFRGNVPGNLAV